MQIKEWGEEGLVEYLSQTFKVSPPHLGIGDDCAVIPENGIERLITTDSLVEGTHFLKEEISPEDLGYKTVAINVSDIAAMGGVPEHAFLTLGLPKEIEIPWVKKLIAGIKEGCSEWKISLLGGDSVESKKGIFLGLTLMGSSPLMEIKYRSSAQIGDVICVTGHLGNSGGGLRALQEKRDEKELVRSHFRPKIYLEEGQLLGKEKGVHAMMDLSDGLSCDLKRLLKSSQKGAVIDIDRLPISELLQKAASQYHWDLLDLALSGGEDYLLLCTMAPEAFKTVQKKLSLYPVGHITKEGLVYRKEGKEVVLKTNPFDHFGGGS